MYMKHRVKPYKMKITIERIIKDAMDVVISSNLYTIGAIDLKGCVVIVGFDQASFLVLVAGLLISAIWSRGVFNLAVVPPSFRNFS